MRNPWSIQPRRGKERALGNCIRPLVVLGFEWIQLSEHWFMVCRKISCGTRWQSSTIQWLKKSLMNTSRWRVSMAMTSGRPSLSPSWMSSKNLPHEIYSFKPCFLAFSDYFNSHSQNIVNTVNKWTKVLGWLYFHMMIQSCNWKSSGIHIDATRMLHGSSLRVRGVRNESRRTCPCWRSSHIDDLHEKPVRRIRYCRQRLLRSQWGNKENSANWPLRVSNAVSN